MLVEINVSECCSERCTSNWSDFYNLAFIRGNKSGFVSWLLFSHVYTYTFIFMLLSPVYREEEEEKVMDILFFFPSSFSYHLSPFFSLNKNTPNPFWDMLRIRSNRLFFFLSLLRLRLQVECVSLALSPPCFSPSLSFSLTLSLFHTHAFRLYTHAHTCTHTDASVRTF